jgi:hypothetical protein
VADAKRGGKFPPGGDIDNGGLMPGTDWATTVDGGAVLPETNGPGIVDGWPTADGELACIPGRGTEI